VGKSMISSTLAMLLAKEKKIVALDADVDAPNLHLWLGQNEDWDKVEKISTNERPVIDRQKCNLCGQCVDICAFGALKINKQKLILNNFFCEGCAACETICPQKAIRMEKIDNAEIRIKNNVFGFPLISAQLYPGETGSGKVVDELKKKAAEFRAEMIVIDSPAGTGCPVIAALNGVDFCLLVTEPTPSGFSDLKRALEVVNYFQIPWGLVINKWDVNKAESKKITSWAGKQAKGSLLGRISYEKGVFRAISQLKPILATELKTKEEIKSIYRRLTNLI